MRGTYDINQCIQRTRPFLNKLSGIVLLPLGLLVVAEVPVERLLAPGAVNRVRNGRERGDGFVFAGVAQKLFPQVSTLSSSIPSKFHSIENEGGGKKSVPK